MVKSDIGKVIDFTKYIDTNRSTTISAKEL